MKKFKIIFIVFFALLFSGSCKQEVIKPVKPIIIIDHSCEDAVAGSADFSKFVAIGSSYTAGFQAGALFTEGQDNSLAAILNTQFQCVGAPAAFNQPTIGSTNGYNIFITPNPDSLNHIFGRFLLQGADPVPTPQLSGIEALPNPQFNPGFIYTGSSAALNNFSVEAITLGQFLIPNTGNWADPNPAHGFSPFYARFASAPGSSTIIGDAAAAGGTFFLFWAGMDDFMLYAAFGGDAKKAPINSTAAFGGQYGAAINALLGSNADLKGVVANFPDIFMMPHFTAVPWNPIPLDAGTATSLTSELADNYNAFLAGMVQNAIITEAEATERHLSFVPGQNPALLNDTELTDLTPYMQGPYAGLQPYARARQSKETDVLPLSAGSVLGTLINNDPNLVNGVTVPLADQYVITPVEKDSINAARIGFNAAIASTQAAHADRLALADVDALMTSLITSHVAVMNGVTITPNINPPTGIYSEDGLHPNTRGYAFISTAIISAINAKFGSTIPLTKINLYQATGLPIP